MLVREAIFILNMTRRISFLGLGPNRVRSLCKVLKNLWTTFFVRKSCPQCGQNFRHNSLSDNFSGQKKFADNFFCQQKLSAIYFYKKTIEKYKIYYVFFIFWNFCWQILRTKKVVRMKKPSSGGRPRGQTPEVGP